MIQVDPVSTALAGILLPSIGWVGREVLAHSRQISSLEQIAKDVSENLKLLRESQEKLDDRLYDAAIHRGGSAEGRGSQG